MVQRTVALCDGEKIGIESIYNIIDGKPIYKKGDVEALREKSRKGKLLCPCGCGAKLILAAGEIRLAHFKIQNNNDNLPCHWIDEGEESINAKLILKYWLETELKTTVQARIQIKNISDNDRRFEYTFLSRDNGIALSYTHKKENLSDEKLDVLFRNTNLKVILFTHKKDNVIDWQYHEWLMKMQNRQGYCLLLDTGDIKSEDVNYNKAIIKAIFYDDIQGTWRENCLAEDYLSNFHIDSFGNVLIRNESLEALLKNKTSELVHEEQRRQKEYERRKNLEELQKKRAEEARRKRDAEQRKILEEQDKERLRKQMLLKEQRWVEEENQRIAEQEKKKHAWDIFYRSVEEYCGKTDSWLFDPDGVRRIKCTHCGKVKSDGEFTTHTANTGICKECYDSEDYVPEYEKTEIKVSKPYDTTICPACGGKLRTKINHKSGKQFYACSNFPNCRYTRSI